MCDLFFRRMWPLPLVYSCSIRAPVRPHEDRAGSVVRCATLCMAIPPTHSSHAAAVCALEDAVKFHVVVVVVVLVVVCGGSGCAAAAAAAAAAATAGNQHPCNLTSPSEV
jgi:hypothetical protein